ncbi:uncharacterized protein LOC105198743 [Solenopsis invicta]|uniref:uncharacterized protein LOC105198743 n=1 Tax=Solenopsis invicta TaxID=13686 RepID=UPI0005961B5E|nr:uncharacterized protein LOC105198743 [Solenopsis invicta]
MYYAGPIQLRTSRGRGQRSYKAFVAVFVCLTTRAVHLEAVSDYTADVFLAALLTAGQTSSAPTPSCGPSSPRAAGSCAGSSDDWRRSRFRRFNPLSAPHFGGIWEAAVKSLKHHLGRVLGDSTLTFEEMSTLLAQVKACLNSRPLQALSDDPEDLSVLIPGHFLVRGPLTALPKPSLTELPV